MHPAPDTEQPQRVAGEQLDATDRQPSTARGVQVRAGAVELRVLIQDDVRTAGVPTPPAVIERYGPQAVDALRHGWPIRIGNAPVLQPIETAYDRALACERLLISASRAATLKLANQREAADPHAPVLVRAAEPLDLPAARPIADPSLDLAAPLKGPFLAEPLDWAEDAAAALDDPVAVAAGVRLDGDDPPARR